MSKLITVKAVGQPDKTVLWEKNKAHPGGEVFLSTGDVAQVAKTPAVEERLRKGTLVKVSGQAEDSHGPEDDSEEGEDKPEIGAGVVMLADAGGPVDNVVAGPEAAANMPPARTKVAVKK